MIDASRWRGDAAEGGQCTSTDKSVCLQIDHFDDCINYLFNKLLLIIVKNVEWSLY